MGRLVIYAETITFTFTGKIFISATQLKCGRVLQKCVSYVDLTLEGLSNEANI